MRRTVWVALVVVVAIGMAFVTLFPLRTFLQQKHQLDSVSNQLRQLRAQDRQLRAQAHQLDTSGEIAMLAHRDYGLVMPGQESYVVLPTTSTTTPTRGQRDQLSHRPHR